MPHAIWKGAITFGLVTIPVALFPAENPSSRLSFHLLDRQDLSPVKQKRVNSRTAEEVPWERIVKGHEVSPGRWVIIEDDDFKAANVEATQSIDILAAVCAEEIAPEYFEKPYYLEPSKAGRKAYALLREALARAGRVALGKIVIRTRQHLVALIPRGDLLLLTVIRYPQELLDSSALDLPSADLESLGVTDAELAIAGELVRMIEADFEPADPRYRDTYRDELLDLIERKAAGAEIASPVTSATESDGEVIDIASLLRRSLEKAKAARTAEARAADS
ncbi:MAG: Ku protein [Actinobacteria bacterium]|nr:Ku protein [Actinomycetota bacterium]